MSTNREQNGRQPPLPNRPTLPSDPRAGNVSDHQIAICRKYVWGKCTKGTHCRFRHDLDMEVMKKILKFCHDFQNKQGCGRVDCTYLHASKEEEDLFRTKNEIPRVLLERYAALAEATNNMQNFEGVPQMMMFCTAPPPPPPPPEPAPASAPAPMLDTAVAPPPPPPINPAQFPIQQPLPPPPPPPTVPSTSVIHSSSVYTGPPAAPVVFPLNQTRLNEPPPSLPFKFDPSRPPPPIPVSNDAIKRRLDTEAGPSKLRKQEGPRLAENPCANCVQQELRIEVYKKELDKIHNELKYHTIEFKQKVKEFENGKELLRALVGPELYRKLMDEYIEGGPPQVQDVMAQLSTNRLMSILEDVLNNFRNMKQPQLSLPLRLDDTLSHLPSFSRVTTPSPSSTELLLHTLIEAIRTNSEREALAEAEVRTSTPVSMNGYNRNGQITEPCSSSASTSNPSRYAVASTSTASRGHASASIAGPSGITSNAVPNPAPPAPVYPSYHPGVPPPINRPYYAQQYSGPVPPNASMTYNSSRSGQPQQMASRPPAPSMAPSMPNYSQYMMGRYPHPPHYYNPYQ